MTGNESPYRVGDRVEYIASPVFDGIIATGERGPVCKVEGGWVWVRWPRSGVHSVPLENVRAAPRPAVHGVERGPNERIWEFVGEDKPPLPNGRERDPYMEQGSHPDCVEYVWDVLGAAVPAECRAQARGTPVLAHPQTDRVFAVAHGTKCALWLIPDDYQSAIATGLTTVMRWSGERTTDLLQAAGDGWVWASWHAEEPTWVRRAYEAGGPSE